MPRRKGDDLLAIVLKAGEAEAAEDRYWAAVVGVNVRSLRKELGWNQTELATRLTAAGWAVDQGIVSALESNSNRYGARPRSRTPITVDRLVLLAGVLGTTWAELMDDRWQRKLRELTRVSKNEVDDGE